MNRDAHNSSYPHALHTEKDDGLLATGYEEKPKPGYTQLATFRQFIHIVAHE